MNEDILMIRKWATNGGSKEEIEESRNRRINSQIGHYHTGGGTSY
jgi:hypothetical protein